MSEKINEIAKNWIKFTYLDCDSDEYEELFWVYEEFDYLISNNVEDAYQVVLTILELDASDEIMSNLGAGPLEDLLGRHNLIVLNKVKNSVKKNKKIRNLLNYVWQGSMEDCTWNSLKKLRKAK